MLLAVFYSTRNSKFFLCKICFIRCPSSYGFSDLIGGDAKNEDLTCVEGGIDKERCVRSCENSTVFPSLPLAVKWLRDTVQQNKSVRLQVIANFWCPISVYPLKNMVR